jgi:alpha-galactosidase
MRLGYFRHRKSDFAEYTPYFIKDGQADLIEKHGIPSTSIPNAASSRSSAED